MDRQRVRADVRRVPAARRARGRPDRAQARVPGWARALHRRLLPLRRRDGRDDADPRPRAPGSRRSARLAGGALDRDDDLPRRGRADEGARGVGRDRGRRRGGRPRARRASCRDALLAVDLLRQRPGRDRRVPRLAPLRPRVEGRARAQELRPRGRRDGDGGADRARLRHRALGRVRLGLDARCSASSRSPPSCSSHSC